MRSSKRGSYYRLGLLIIVLVFAISGLANSITAQDVAPGSQPPTPIGGILDTPPDTQPLPALPIQTLTFPETRDFSQVCQNITDQSPNSTGARPMLVQNTNLSVYNLIDGRQAMTAHIALPPGALLTATGPAAWVNVTQGAVAIVSCEGDLLFDLTPGDNAQFALPAGAGLIVDPLIANGVFLSLDEMVDWAWIIQLGDGATSILSMEAEIGSEMDVICDRLGCWNTSQVVVSTNDGPTTTGGGPCAYVRCWSR